MSFFFWFGPHKEVLCLVLSPWLLFSCSLMQARVFSQSRGAFSYQRRKENTHPLSAAPRSFTLHTKDGSWFQQRCTDSEARAAPGPRDRHLGHFPQQVPHAEHSGPTECLNACPSIYSEITLKCFSCSLLKSGHRIPPPPPPSGCYKAILCCGGCSPPVSHWGRWSRSLPGS